MILVYHVSFTNLILEFSICHRETLTTAARLQMGPDEGAEVGEVVERLIEKLGLSKAADTIVGNAKVKRQITSTSGCPLQHFYPSRTNNSNLCASSSKRALSTLNISATAGRFDQTIAKIAPGGTGNA